MIRALLLNASRALTSSFVRDVVIATVFLSTVVYCGAELWGLKASLEPFGRKQLRDTAEVSRAKQLVLPEGLIGQRSEYVVLLVISTQCHFCTESMDFYRDLTSHYRSARLRFVAICPQTPQQCSEYLGRYGVSVNRVASASSSDVGVPGTPTILLVDRTLTTLATWIGRQNPEGEHAIRSQLLRVAGLHR
jgi:hypothetical protein